MKMNLVLPTSEKDYIHIPNTEDYITKNLIVGGNYFDQTKLVHGNGALILTPNDSIILDFTLIKRIRGEIELYDGKGDKIEPRESSLILDDRHAPAENYRGENLDAQFNKGKISFYKLENGEFISISENLHENTLMVDKGINLVDFVMNENSHTSQGLPAQDIREGDFHYYYPRKGRVARVDAGTDGAFLDCDWGPSGSDVGFVGVRAKISTGNLKQFLEELRDRYKVQKGNEDIVYFTRERLVA